MYETQEQVEAVKISIDRALTDMSNDVSEALKNPEALAEEFRDIWCDALFYMTYNGQLNAEPISRFNDQVRRLVETAFGDVERRAIANRAARHQEPGPKKIRLAFVSAFIFGHSIWKIPMVGYYENLDRSRFEIYTYQMSTTSDAFTDDARTLSDSFYGSPYVGDIVRQLGEDAPDVLIFPDVGMNFSSYCITTLRLAPLQLQMLGIRRHRGRPKSIMSFRPT